MNYFKDYFSNQIEQYVLVSYDERKWTFLKIF
jgi:hypothetical protein